MVYSFKNYTPKVKDTVFIAPGARVVGRVELDDYVSIWFNSVVRGDIDIVKVGRCTNIQDGCILHEDAGYPLIIGKNVTVAHSATLHGCTVEDGAMIGMGAVVLSGAKIGKGAMVAAGTLVLQGQEVPSGMVAMGSPAKVARELSEKEKLRLKEIAEIYVKRAQIFKGQNMK